MPGYIRAKEATAHFTNQVAKIAVAGDGRLRLTFSTPRGWEKAPVLYLGPASLLKGKYVKLEVKPYHGKYRLLLTYEDRTEMPGRPDHPGRILGLDPGLDNFLAGVTNTGALPFLISGKWLKSRNQWFNKERARLLSARTKGKDSRHSEKASRRLSALSRKREDTFRDFFYKAAHWVCRYSVRYRIEAIVIGHNEGQKQERRAGRGCRSSSGRKAIPRKPACGMGILSRPMGQMTQKKVTLFPGKGSNGGCTVPGMGRNGTRT